MDIRTVVLSQGFSLIAKHCFGELPEVRDKLDYTFPIGSN